MLSYVLATKLAGATGTVAGVIEDLLVTFANEEKTRGHDEEDHPEDTGSSEG